MSKIVLIEETFVLRLRLEKVLKSIGFNEIIEFSKVGKTLESAYNRIKDASVIVIDFDYSSDLLDEVLEIVKKYHYEYNPKIIVLTQHAEYELMLKLYEKGVGEVVLKPFSDEIIKEKIVGLNNEFEKEGTIIIEESVTNVVSHGGATMLKWCKDYEIGIDAIDKEHKDIIEHFEKLYLLMKEGKGKEYYNDIIRFLNDYVEVHFSNEEKLQKSMNYDKYNEHKKLHDEFRSHVSEYIEKTDWHTISNKDLLSLNLFLKEWLINHIMVEDKKLGVFYNKR